MCLEDILIEMVTYGERSGGGGWQTELGRAEGSGGEGSAFGRRCSAPMPRRRKASPSQLSPHMATVPENFPFDPNMPSNTVYSSGDSDCDNSPRPRVFSFPSIHRRSTAPG